MAKILYTNPKGEPRSRSSYSARKDFKFCKRKFRLTRVDGWRRRQWGVSLVFGNCIEAAVFYHVENHGKGGSEKFCELWQKARTSPDFNKYTYSKAEVSWESLLRAGRELMIIFAARLDKLPLVDGHGMPRFQVPLRKQVFPNSPEYVNIENDAYLDVLATVAWNHPALTPLSTFVPPTRTVIIDIKTSAKRLRSELVRLDPQLVEYAWMLKTTLDVAFLNFIKSVHGMKGGSDVTLLETVGEWEPGFELKVIEMGKQLTLVGPYRVFKYVDDMPDNVRGISAQIAGAQWVKNEALSKQSLQFVTARLTEEEVADCGKLVGQTTVEMIMAHEASFYPQEGGIRFPDEKCNFCDMRYICSNDSRGRDENLSRAGEEWLDVATEG